MGAGTGIQGGVPTSVATNVFSPPRVTEFGHLGRNYLKTSPLSLQGRIGSYDSASIPILNDVCSNVSLMDAGTFRSNYPTTPIEVSYQLDIRGIGSSFSIGHAQVQIWMEGFRHVNGLLGTQALIEMTVEIHLVENFGHQLLLGMDMLKDYGIDFLVTKNTAMMSGGEFTCPVSSVNAKFRSVLVRAKKDVSIFRRTCKCISVTSHMLLGVDYLFEPHYFLQQGKSAIPSLSLPYAVVNRGMVGLMFQNAFDSPIHLKKWQVIGRATTDIMAVSPMGPGMNVDWCDLVQPGT